LRQTERDASQVRGERTSTVLTPAASIAPLPGDFD
jgi:hypothetical protein